MNRSPFLSRRRPDKPPKPRNREVRISPLRYSSEPNRTRERSRVSNDGIGRALTSIETGVVTENWSGVEGWAAAGRRSAPAPHRPLPKAPPLPVQAIGGG